MFLSSEGNPAQKVVRRWCEAAALAECWARCEVPTAAELAARTDELRLEWCRAMGRKGAKKARAAMEDGHLLA